jgi:heavy metal translocating P-type ATPase
MSESALLRRSEARRLAFRLSVSLAALCLLLVAVGLTYAVPGGAALGNVVAGVAAALVVVPVMNAAWWSLRAPSLHGVTDLLVALAVIAAWAEGELVTAAFLPIVMTIGHVLEERSLLGSQEAIRALSRLTQSGARVLQADGSVRVVAAQRLEVGDVVEMRPGDRLAADGVVRSGRASLDMASLTGESVPVEVGPGDTALAGALSVDGRLEVTITRVGRESTLGRIIGLMRSAEASKPPLTRLLDRLAGQYLLLVLLVAAGTWFASGNTAATLAVLVASCPCALVLAAPATAIAAIAVAARHGILIKGAAFLETLAEVTSVIFDKTGTITTGTLRLVSALPEAGVSEARLCAVAASLGALSQHPVSRAASALAAPLSVTELHEAGGFGVTGVLDGATVAMGRADLLARLGITHGDPPAHDGPVAAVAEGGRLLGWLLFADAPREEAADAIAELRVLGLDRQSLLTGDRASVAGRIAGLVGIDEVFAEALPDQKLAVVRAAVARGERPLVVGDGINDSLALKAGAVGIAMGGGASAAALAAADLVLMSNDLRRLGTCLRLSRRCRSTIHANVAIGLGWTVLLVGAAAAGWLGTEGAIVAALLHNVGTFAGLANAGRLLRFQEG